MWPLTEIQANSLNTRHLLTTSDTVQYYTHIILLLTLSISTWYAFCSLYCIFTPVYSITITSATILSIDWFHHNLIPHSLSLSLLSQCSCSVLRSSPSGSTSVSGGPGSCPAQTARSHGSDGHNSRRCGCGLGCRPCGGQRPYRSVQRKRLLWNTKAGCCASGKSSHSQYISM